MLIIVMQVKSSLLNNVGNLTNAYDDDTGNRTCAQLHSNLTSAYLVMQVTSRVLSDARNVHWIRT